MSQPLTLTVAEAADTAHRMAKELRGGEVLGLIGPLGAGKTTFVQALGRELGVKKYITSPTFVLMQQYQGIFPLTKRNITLYHLDLYRTSNFDDLAALGITEIWQKPDTLVIIEWADKVLSYLPRHTRYLYFS